MAHNGRRARAGKRGLVGMAGRAVRSSSTSPPRPSRAGSKWWRWTRSVRPARIALGRALQEEGRLAEARTHYLKADELQPHASQPQVNLGWLHELNGEMDQAEAAFRRAIERQPKLPCAARPAGEPAARASCPTPTWLRSKTAWRTPIWPRAPALHLLFGLAHVLDGRGDYARAAECLARSQRPGPRGTSTNATSTQPADHERYVDGLIQAFDADLFSKLAGAGSEQPPAGLRVRTAALGHDADRAGPGQPFANPWRGRAAAGPAVVREIPTGSGRPLPPRDCIPLLDAATIRRLAEHASRSPRRDRRRPGSSESWTRCPTITCTSACSRSCSRSAVFIHCRRDLRDVAVSCWMTDFTSIRWANDPAHIASRFRQYRRVMDHWRDGAAGADPSRRLRGDGRRPGVGRAETDRRCAASSGSRPASTSIEPSGRSAPRASRRCASRSIRDRSRAGRTTSQHSRRCSRRSPADPTARSSRPCVDRLRRANRRNRSSPVSPTIATSGLLRARHERVNPVSSPRASKASITVGRWPAAPVFAPGAPRRPSLDFR